MFLAQIHSTSKFGTTSMRAVAMRVKLHTRSTSMNYDTASRFLFANTERSAFTLPVNSKNLESDLSRNHGRNVLSPELSPTWNREAFVVEGCLYC